MSFFIYLKDFGRTFDGVRQIKVIQLRIADQKRLQQVIRHPGASRSAEDSQIHGVFCQKAKLLGTNILTLQYSENFHFAKEILKDSVNFPAGSQ